MFCSSASVGMFLAFWAVESAPIRLRQHLFERVDVPLKFSRNVDHHSLDVACQLSPVVLLFDEVLRAVL